MINLLKKLCSLAEDCDDIEINTFNRHDTFEVAINISWCTDKEYVLSEAYKELLDTAFEEVKL